MKKNKEKITKEKMRRIWIIIALSNCEKWTQDKLIDYLNEISVKILKYHIDNEKEIYEAILSDLQDQNDDKLNFNPNFEITNERMDKPKISKVLTSLKNDKIINETQIESNKRGPNPKGYSLNYNYKTLHAILTELLDSGLDQYTFSFLADLILSSKYSKRSIDHKLIEKIEKTHNYQFNSNEKKMILELIKVSPRALITALNQSSFYMAFKPDPSFETIYGHNKDTFIFQLQLKLGEDIMNLSKLNNKKIRYNITICMDNKPEVNNFNGKIESELISKFDAEFYINMFSNKDLSAI